MSDATRPRSRRLLASAGAAMMAVTLAGSAPHASASSPDLAAAASVQTVVSSLNIPWDVSFFRNGDMLFTERGGRIVLRTAAGNRTIKAPMSDLYVASEGGLMGLVVDPTTVHSYFYTCQTYKSGSNPVDVRIIQWKLSADGTSAARQRVVVSGLPLTSGRHSGCRLRFTPGYRLNAGTGDAATGVNPQNLDNLGGKTLRMDPRGPVPSDNPYAGATTNRRWVSSYGHRNVQGLDVRPGTSQLWSQEQGTTRDDETNAIVSGGNYGYDPVPGYNESVPMTDTTKFPNAIRARWSSGSSTVATSGITFLRGSGWGRWNGALAVAELKGQGVRVLTLNSSGQVTRQEQLPALDNTYGRIRTVQSGPGGALYVTTSNGSNDKVLRLPPYAPPA
ncbi:PQQ-dependent sugar dehydrogenase [Luteipulveratus sp. YIM 133132]|uniref:PQQ-dependent sugar dehydrogenase n=1 Tax=Luteipulveratus flavus TaxID=3031728 RepID=UPI0023B025EB|nr:PQQ-dependent sugar dehydrogenase [Luteipulveratus sp. YIM 133132]MDE9364709.1 PQQ-dependent sugar dehydrogenase [Luteipulveratus sp. YIM 133132]